MEILKEELPMGKVYDFDTLVMSPAPAPAKPKVDPDTKPAPVKPKKDPWKAPKPKVSPRPKA